MTTCTCFRCEEITECLVVTFIEQHGFDDETTYELCEDCYTLYSSLYRTRLEDEEYDETPIETDEDPSPPDTTTIETDIDNPL